MANTITQEEFDTFKANVVEVALATAKRHGLCEVVQRTLCKAGFADQLPAVYQVHIKRGPDGRWDDNSSDFEDLDKAKAEAVKRRKDALRRARDSAKYEIDYRTREFSLNITNLTVDEAKARIEKAVKDYQLKKRQAAGEVTEWPKVRVVKRIWQDNGRQKTETVEYVK